MISVEEYNRYISKIANTVETRVDVVRYLFAFSVFFASISTYLFHVFVFVASILAILFIKKEVWFDRLKKNKIIISSIAFVSIMFISIGYSDCPISNSLVGFFKYFKVLYILPIIPLFIDYKWRRIVENFFILGVVCHILIIILYNMDISDGHLDFMYVKSWYVFDISEIHPIWMSWIMSFAFFTCLNRIFSSSQDNKKMKYLNIFFSFLIFFALFFLQDKRTGQILCILGIIYMSYTYHRIKGLLYCIICMPLIFLAVIEANYSVYNKFESIVRDVVAFSSGNSASSVGSRLDFLSYGFKMFVLSPIFGRGVGSFEYLYARSHGPFMYGYNQLPREAHDEFMMILLQVGVVGLIFYIYWIISQIKETKYIAKTESIQMRFLIISLIISSFSMSTIYTGITGMIYLIFIGIYSACRYENEYIQ